MFSNQYIMIGAPIITKEIFRNILIPLNNYSYKPNGAFWASNYISNIATISEWFTYLQDTHSIAKYKDINKGVIFTLNENAKILTINSPEQVLELAKKYPSYHHILGHYKNITEQNTIFDFQKLSLDYDGVYIDYNKFLNQLKTVVFDNLGSNSLILFNLNCIKHYQSTTIEYNIDSPYSIPFINEDKIEAPQKIEQESYEHKIIEETTEKIFLNLIDKYNNYPFNDYDEYITTLTQTIKQTILIINKEEEKKIVEILKYLQNKKINIEQERLIQTFALNYLSKYILQNQNKIKSLKKSTLRSSKKYPIF